MQARRPLLLVVAAALCLTALVAVIELLSGQFDETSWRILGTTTAISFFGLLGVPAGMLLERGRTLLLARASAALTTLGFVLTIAVIWHEWSTGVGKAWGVVLTLALAAAQAAAVEARRRDSDTRAIAMLVAASMVTGAVLAAMGVLAILTEIDEQGYYRFLGAVAIVDVLLIALVAVLRRGSGPVTRTHRVRVDGRMLEVPGRDWAAAVATAIREAEKSGSAVKRIERA